MKFLNRLVTLLVFAVLVGAGVVGAVAAVSDAWWRALGAFVGRDAKLLAGCGATGLLCLAVLMATTGARRKRRERILSFRNADGTVSISTEAIGDYVTKLLPEFPSIVRMQPRVIPQRRALDVVVDVRIKPGPQIHEVCEVLQRRVRETLTNGLGIQEVRRVAVVVREISPEHKPD